MPRQVSRVTIAMAAACGFAVVAVTVLPVAGQAPAAQPAAAQGRGRGPAPAAAPASTYRAPRTPDGKPDLNGIWQTTNEANWDIEPHMAKPALQMRPGPVTPVPAVPVLYMGAVGSVPPGMGSSPTATRFPTSPKRSRSARRTRTTGRRWIPR